MISTRNLVINRFSNRTTSSSPKLVRQRAARQEHRQLVLEVLEHRRVLTTYLVDTLIDDASATAAEVDGQISLREAALAANSNAAFGDAPAGESGGIVDEITFDSLAGKTITLDGEQLVISDDLSITGLGPENLAVSGGNLSRIFGIELGVSVELAGLKLSDGVVSGGGGAIRSLGHLTVVNTTISENTANVEGGGIWNDGLLEISNVTFADNASPGGQGAGIRNYGDATVRYSAFTGNEAGGNGGGISNTESGTLSIIESTFTENSGSVGGAIDNDSTGIVPGGPAVVIAGSKFAGNSGGAGGAFWNKGTAELNGNTFSQNSARGWGGAIANGGNAAAIVIIANSFIGNDGGSFSGAIDNSFGGSIEIRDSLLTGNFASREGGAIENLFATMTIANSTISGNTTNGSGGAIWNRGTLEVTQSSIVLNRADADGDDSGSGGGLLEQTSSSFPRPVLNNTIIGGNLLGAPLADTASDIVGALDGSSSHNLVGDAATAGGLTDATNGNIVGNGGVGTLDITTVLDPILADNGGTTLTHALLPGGLAVNAGENTRTVDASGDPLDHDQRGDGFARIVDATVDIGSFELPPQPQIIEIDVKPGSDLNSINLANNGVIAVSILTTDDFDAASVDANTVQFADAGAVHHSLEDVDGDGDLDMVLHFRVQETNLAEIYADLLSEDSESNHQSFAVALTGATLGGTSFTGSDGVDMFFAGKALRDLLNELERTGVL